MEVCGIDPGLGTTGYAVLSIGGPVTTVLDAGVCRTDPGADLPVRLAQLEADFRDLLASRRPSFIGVEQLYAHYKHPRTAILMGHARGVILCLAAQFGVPICHFSATRVKRFLTGNGRASKSQMQRAVRSALGLPELPDPPDVADALAIALCCAHEVRRPAELMQT